MKICLDADKVRAESEKKRIMILMSDTGGGHRASAEALKAGFEKLYGDKYTVKPLRQILSEKRFQKNSFSLRIICSTSV